VKPFQIARTGSDPKGFALVEIVVAIGVAAFTLTAILGLLSAGMKSSKDSIDDTAVANMANYVLSDMRARSFTNFVDPVTSTVLSPTQDIYFDAGGRCLLSGTGATATPMDRTSALNAGALYLCQRLIAASSTNGDGSVNPCKVTLAFSWPVQAPTPATKRFYGTLTQY